MPNPEFPWDQAPDDQSDYAAIDPRVRLTTVPG